MCEYARDDCDVGAATDSTFANLLVAIRISRIGRADRSSLALIHNFDNGDQPLTFTWAGTANSN